MIINNQLIINRVMLKSQSARVKGASEVARISIVGRFGVIVIIYVVPLA